MKDGFPKALLMLTICVLFASCGGICGESELMIMDGAEKIIEFGTYEQDGNFENGEEPIEWIVLTEENERQFIISKKILELKQYNEKRSFAAASSSNAEYGGPISLSDPEWTTWEKSTIRRWLNRDFFMTAFSDEIRNRIVQNGEDFVFLLTEEQAETYATEELCSCELSQYCRNQGETAADWMLKDLNIVDDMQYVSIVKGNGTIAKSEALSGSGMNGVRPTMWVLKE